MSKNMQYRYTNDFTGDDEVFDTLEAALACMKREFEIGNGDQSGMHLFEETELEVEFAISVSIVVTK